MYLSEFYGEIRDYFHTDPIKSLIGGFFVQVEVEESVPVGSPKKKNQENPANSQTVILNFRIYCLQFG